MVSLLGIKRLSLDGMMVEAESAIADGIHMIEVFPAVADELKTEKVSLVCSENIVNNSCDIVLTPSLRQVSREILNQTNMCSFSFFRNHERQPCGRSHATFFQRRAQTSERHNLNFKKS